jgi:hypothetical protein
MMIGKTGVGISIVLAVTHLLFGCKLRDPNALKNDSSSSPGGGAPSWTASPKEGRYLSCKSEQAMKRDFIGQLQRHYVYGDVQKIKSLDSSAGEALEYYQNSLTAQGVKSLTFANLDETKVFDGSKGFSFLVNGVQTRPQAGDILLNMNFGHPDRPGNFYSKRGMAHARLVVGYLTTGELVTLDGGWKRFSVLSQIHSQTVWIRPKSEYFNATDRQNLVKWAKLLEPVKYDNTLTDDWSEFRKRLHSYIDSGLDRVAAREKALDDAKTNAFAPGASPDSFLPPSGIYCSEGAAAIFAYLGFKMNGETAFDMISKFSKLGKLPSWAVYADALSGFGADSDPNTFMMHNLFHSYFSFFDSGKQGLITAPGLDLASMNFSDGMKANIQAAMADGGASDLLSKQLDEASAKLLSDPPAKAQVDQLKASLLQVSQTLGQQFGVANFNITKAVYALFFQNLAYGPHVFMESANYFDLVGVFYNSDLARGYQAKWIADWWLNPYGQPRQEGNISTTLYKITADPALSDDECVPGLKAPLLPTK